uniref:Neural Wiskott-Aldrich syndrome protein n=3 Tax=Lygus hesperus TaxID=30085 RepID=A0A0A9X600_LYGHE
MKLTMPEYKSSSLLSSEENDLVFSMLGPRCQTLATTVVELYSTGSRDSDKWYYKDVGVLCLVKDNARRSYFFRLFCLIKKQMIWEHEIYNNMNYLAPTSFLHTFEAEDCIIAFNFADEDEGVFLRKTLLQKLETKKQRRMDKRNRSHNNNVAMPRTIQGPEINSTMPTANKMINNKSRAVGKKDGKKRLTKADIGLPENFKHISHVGWDPNKGFDFGKIEDPQLKEFLLKAGVSESHLRDKDTRDFIYDFIQRNGGMEAVAGALDVAPPVPSRAKAPPPPPTRAPPAIPPPPPPPIRTLPPRSLPPSPKAPVEQSEFKPPPPPPVPGAPMPPPPPPIPVDNPMAPPAAPPSAPPDDPRSALMEAIRNGPQLRPVNNVDNEAKKPSDSRGDLLDQIRQGVELKPVSQIQQSSNSAPASESKGLAGALARALLERSKAINPDSDESEDEDEEEEDEWEE